MANLLDDAYTSKVSFAAGDTLTVSADEPMQGVYLNGLRWKAAIACHITEKSRKSRRKICFISILILGRQLQNVQ